MKILKSRGFTLTEVLITVVIAALTTTGCWAIYVMGNDFYHNAMHSLRVQNIARTTADAMLYGVGGDGLMQASGFAVGGGGANVTYNGRILSYNAATRQISYTENAGNPLDLTPAYIQAAGGIAVTEFNINTFDANGDGTNERVTVTFRVESLWPNTNPDPNNHGPGDIRAELELTISTRGRMI